MPAVAPPPRRPGAVPIRRRSRLGPVARWFLPAFLLTASLHGLGFLIIRHVPYANLGAVNLSRSREERRVFHMKTAEIDPRLLDAAGAQPQPTPSDRPPTTPEPRPAADLRVPGEKPSFAEELARANVVLAAPKIADQTMAMNDRPKVERSQDLSRTLEENSAGSARPEDLRAQMQTFLNAQPNVTRAHPAFNVNGPEDASQANAGPNATGRANFSNLDGLLSQRGPLTGREGPLLMPTDLMFDYDAAILRTDAAGSLEKLGQLIRQNPQATFTIEGYTDLFGSPEYNQVLSQRRAESVKAWLVQNERIDPARITTRGFGSRKPLVPGGSVEAQQMNRRVEIVIHTNRR